MKPLVFLATPVAIASPCLVTAVQGEPYQFQLLPAFGDPPYRWSVAGSALPAGFTTAITFQIEDARKRTAQRKLTLVVEPDTAPAIETERLPDAPTAQRVAVRIAGRGGNGALLWTLPRGQTLPPGFALGNDGTLAGTPVRPGSYSFEIEAQDADPAQPEVARKKLTMEITPAPAGTVLIPTAEKGAIKVDGTLDEPAWQLEHRVEKPAAGAQSSASERFGAVVSEGTLYLGVEVTDPEVTENPAQPAAGSSVEIYLDLLNNREASYNFDDRRITVTPGGKMAIIGSTRVVGAKYGGAANFYFEPHIGSAVFHELLAETKVKVLTGRTLKAVTREGARLTAFECTDGSRFAAKAFVDASYEGDLMAKAGVRYIVGREARDTYGESFAGIQDVHLLDKLLDSPEVITKFHPVQGPHPGESSLMKPTIAYYKARYDYLNSHQWPVAVNGRDAQGRPLPGITAEPLGTPGAADHRFMAYDYRLCLTRKPADKVPITQPDGYDPAYLELLARYIEKWPDITLGRLFHIPDLPNQTTDLNTSGPYSTDLLDGSAWAYPEADWAERDRIAAHHRRFIQGMLWFLGHDPRVPAKLREETLSWGLNRREFADNDHWPWQLYVRVARRMIGEHVMTQRDVTEAKEKPDSVAMGSFIIDSHNIRRVLTPDGFVLNEGGIEIPTHGAYEIPYRSLTPKAAECENLLVPVRMSSSYVAYCSIRMEPVYMMMGQASGAAAALSAKSTRAVQAIGYDELKQTLAQQKQTVLKLPSRPVKTEPKPCRAGTHPRIPTPQINYASRFDAQKTREHFWSK